MVWWPYILDITLGLAALVYANLPHMLEPKNWLSRMLLRVAGYAILGIGIIKLTLWVNPFGQ